MPKRIYLAAILPDERGVLSVKHIGQVEQGMGGRYACAAPAETLALVSPNDARKLARDLVRWASRVAKKENPGRKPKMAGCSMCFRLGACVEGCPNAGG